MQAILHHVSWICRTPRQLRSGSRGYIERPASFAPALVDMSNAPPASFRLSWIYRTPRQLRSGSPGYLERSAQLRSGSRGYVERSASFAPPLVDMSNAPPASLRKAWQNRRADSGLPPLWIFYDFTAVRNSQSVIRRASA